MGDLINNLIEAMSPETVKIFKDLNFKSGSDLNTEKLNNLEQELENTMFDAHEKEIHARMAMEEREIEIGVNLNKTLTAELERVTGLIKSFEIPQSDSVATMTVKAKMYNKKADATMISTELDVCQLEDLYTEIEAKEKQVREIEKRLSKYSGLPPNISRAKQAIRDLTREIETLEDSESKKIEEEVSQFINTIFHR